MYPSQFEYQAPTSLDEALSLLSQSGGEAKLLAGGHSLLPLLKLRMTETRSLIDLGRIPGLDYVRREGDQVAIGAMTTHAAIERSAELRQLVPLLPEAARVIGDLQVRNRGTIGGSLAHADPAGDFPAVVLALDAELKVRGSKGERAIKATDFFVDLLTTALEPDEILLEIRVPLLPARTGTSYQKFPQPASRYAICGAAAVVTLSEDDSVSRVRLGMTGVGPKAYRATAVEEAVVGQKATAEAIAQAAQHAAAGIEPLGDLHASTEYRAHLARVFARRALTQAAERARG
jgi:carbon-monoxide dehydrogenase medium subunit